MHVRPLATLLCVPLLALGTGCISRAPLAPADTGTHGQHHDAHDHEHRGEHDLRGAVAAPTHHADRTLLRARLACGWCDPYRHAHGSPCGTPYVHGFLVEPAFLGSDLFLDVARGDGETEVEAEVEWALTRRVGLIAELPWIDADERGLGDAALGVRVLLLEERRFLLSLAGEIEVPTGSEVRGLGEGHVAFGGSLHTWLDLGAWFTLQAVAGVEHVPDEGETALRWGASLAKSFRARPLICNGGCGNAAHRRPVWSLLAEIAGDTALEGDEDRGTTQGSWLLGASYPLAYDVDLRGAFTRSFGGDEHENAWLLGIIVHF